MATRTERLEVRLTPEEKKQLLIKATTLGITLTELLVSCALGEKLADSVSSKRKAR